MPQIYQNHQQRKRTIYTAQTVVQQAENWLTIGLLLLLLFPWLLNPHLNLAAWLWWVKGCSFLGIGAWVLLQTAVATSLAPAHLTGATVDAMEQTVPSESLVALPERQLQKLPVCLSPPSSNLIIPSDTYQQRQQQRCSPRRRALFLLARPLAIRPALDTDASA